MQFVTLDSEAIEALPEISEVLLVGLQPLVLTMAGKNSKFRPIHCGRVLTDLPELLEHPGCVNVDDQNPACFLAGPFSGDDAIDVL